MEVWMLLLFALALSMAMAMAWGVRQTTGNSGWIDAIWSLSVGAVGVAAALLPASGVWERRLAAALFIAIWSLRLGGHIVFRTIGGGDDPRYAEMMQTWGESAGRRLFVFLQVQALCGLVLIVAVSLAAANPTPFPRIQDLAAIVLLATAILGEAIADRQLAVCRRRQVKICEAGLWRWSRHPNYFFEWLGWCSWPLLAIDLSGAHPWGLLALAAPALMYWLLVHASGIPPLEKHMLATRGEAFRLYQRRVNAFFPGPRRQV